MVRGRKKRQVRRKRQRGQKGGSNYALPGFFNLYAKLAMKLGKKVMKAKGIKKL